MTLWQLTCGVVLSLAALCLSGVLMYWLSYLVLVILPKKEEEKNEKRSLRTGEESEETPRPS